MAGRLQPDGRVQELGRHGGSPHHSAQRQRIQPRQRRARTLPPSPGRRWWRRRRAAGSPIQSERRRVAAHRRERLESDVQDHRHHDRPGHDLHLPHEGRTVADIREDGVVRKAIRGCSVTLAGDGTPRLTSSCGPVRPASTSSAGASGESVRTRRKSHSKAGRPERASASGFMVSALARDSNRTVPERTNIVMVDWPY